MKRGISSGSCWPSASSVSDRGGAVRERAREPRSQRGALALVGDLADDLGPRGLGVGGGVVGRAVVDDDHRQVPARGLDDRGDPRAFLVARHQRDDARPGRRSRGAARLRGVVVDDLGPLQHLLAGRLHVVNPAAVLDGRRDDLVRRSR